MSWVEEVLREWGGWLRSKGDGQGWGGSLDLDRLFELARGQRNAGEHSDPTMAEVAATAADGQSAHQQVNRFVMLCEPILRRTAILRYAGIYEPTDTPERTDRARYVVGRIEYGSGPTDFVEVGSLMFFRETAGLPVAQVAEVMRVGRTTVYERLERLHAQIKAELIQTANERKKRADAISRRDAA